MYVLLGKNIVLIVSMAAMFIILMNVETDNSQLKRVQTVYNSMFAEDVRTTLMKKRRQRSCKNHADIEYLLN